MVVFFFFGGGGAKVFQRLEVLIGVGDGLSTLTGRTDLSAAYGLWCGQEQSCRCHRGIDCH